MSRYRFTLDGKDAFVIECVDKDIKRSPVKVALHPDGTGIVVTEPEQTFLDHKTPYKFHAYKSIITNVVRNIWKNGSYYYKPITPKGKKPFKGRGRWIREQTAKTISKRFHEHWLNLHSRAQKEILELDKRMFSCSYKDIASNHMKEILKHKYLVSDIMNYRAAAYTMDLIDGFSHMSETNYYGKPMQLLADLDYDWKALHSADNKNYTSLNKTLMNLPGGLGRKIILDIRHLRLPRPIIRKSELTLAVQYASDTVIMGNRLTEERIELGRIFCHTSHEQIKEGARILSDYFTENDTDQFGIPYKRLSVRKTTDIISMMIHVQDAYVAWDGNGLEIPRNANFITLVNGSIDWHRGAAERRLARRNENEQIRQLREEIKNKPETKTLLPPIDLPEDSDIKFLATVQDILDTKKEMGNCIDTYAAKAVLGKCYLFRVAYQGEVAAVEISPEGKVRQSQGPKWADNKASKWAEKRLARWGKSLKTKELYSGRTTNTGMQNS